MDLAEVEFRKAIALFDSVLFRSKKNRFYVSSASWTYKYFLRVLREKADAQQMGEMG